MAKSDQGTKKAEFTTFEKWLVGSAIVFAVLGLLTFITSIFLFNHNEFYDTTQKVNTDKFGSFGSFVSGAVGTMWALVSVILFYLTLRLQRKELALQREELELTRGELEGQKNQMILQNQTLKQQQFENTFFQLLKTHNDIINSMDLRSSLQGNPVISSGRDCFSSFYKRLNANINSCHLNDSGEGERIDVATASLQNTIKGYEKFYNLNQADLGHYFRNLYHIIKFVDQADTDNKKRYTNFVRAQLSSNELVILFYNCLTSFGKTKFKPLIQEYSLLKNMNKTLVFNQAHLFEYSDKAYGK